MITSFVGQQSVLVQAEDMLSCWQCSFELGWGRGGLVVNASNSGSRRRGFEPHSGQTMLCP